MFDFDPSKMFATLPAFDVKPLVAAQQKNIDAIVKASTLMSEGMQAVLKRQVEIAQAGLATGMAAAKDPSALKDFDMKKQMGAFQTASEKAIAETKELVEMATASSTQAFEILRARNEEAVGEFKSMLKAA